MFPRRAGLAALLASLSVQPLLAPLHAQRAKRVVAPPGATASRSSRAPNNYVIDYWNTEAGLPQNSVNAVMQARDGYLWLGTFGGIARFDGTSFFSITTGDYPELRSDRVRALAEDRAGRVWIGTEAGLSRYERGHVVTLGVKDGLPSDIINALAAAPDGSVWFGTQNGALGRVDPRGALHTVVPASGSFGRFIDDLLIDSSSTLWIGGQTGIWRFDTRAADASPIQVLPVVAARGYPWRLALGRGGSSGVWSTTDSGLVHFIGGATQRISLMGRPGFTPRKIRAIAASAGNSLWLGDSNTVWRYQVDSATLTPVEGLQSQNVVSLTVDREGSLWIGDRITGLTRVSATLFETYTAADGLPSDNVVSAFTDSRNRLWVGGRCGGVSVGTNDVFKKLELGHDFRCVTTVTEDTAGAMWLGGGRLVRWKDGVLATYDSVDGVRRGPVRALYTDRRGTVWIATTTGLASWDGHRFTGRLTDGSAATRNIRTIHQSPDGTIWLGSERGLLRFTNGTFVQYTTANGLPNNFVRAIVDDSAGGMWLATYGGGLAHFHDGKFQSFSTHDGLYDNYLSSVVDDGRGNLWMSSNRGVFRVARRELEQYAATHEGRLHSVAYGRADGMLSSEANGGFQSGVARTADGRLWYPTLVGVAVVNPNAVSTSVPPAVVVERVLADGAAQDPSSALSLGPDVSTFDITYSGLSLARPNAVTFRYRLEGWDRDWIDAGTRRTATYSRLPHGTYTFRVTAANREGAWSADTATMSFTILPHYWQTWWFRALAAAALIGLAIGGYRARVHRVRVAAEAAEREASQRRIAVILESITDGFMALDRDARLTYVNRTAERVLGKPAPELIGKSFWEVFPAARDTVVARELARVTAERVPVVFEAQDMPARDSWLEMHAYPTNDGMSVYFTDVTARKQDEEALRNQKEEIEAQAEELAQQTEELARQNEILEENVRLKDEVERISRHDLRTPLNTIISLSQIVRAEAALPAEHQTSLNLIEQAGYRVLHMASLTLDLFKMEQGTYELAARPVDLGAAIDRTLVDLQALMRTCEVSCTVAFTGFAGRPAVQADELLTQAMLGNVIKNAIEASPRGGRVSIEVVAGSPVEVRVHNAGAIPADVRERFFDKYATSGKKGGTGLGAYSARLMARTQRGDITFTSSIEQGTTMVITLPAGSAMSASAPAALPPEPRGNLPPRSILIVDDDATNRSVLRHFLMHPAWQVDDVENGPLAVSRALERRYDVIFMDIEMPVMDGLEATERIRANERAAGGVERTRIIVFSSHDDAATRDRAARAGCDAYLVKPATRQAIIEAVLGQPVIPAAVATLDPAMQELVPAFLERKRAEVGELRDAVSARDVETVRRLAHRLRGSFALYGFTDASAMAATLDDAARAGRLDEAADKAARTLYDHVHAMDGGDGGRRTSETSNLREA